MEWETVNCHKTANRAATNYFVISSTVQLNPFPMNRPVSSCCIATTRSPTFRFFNKELLQAPFNNNNRINKISFHQFIQIYKISFLVPISNTFNKRFTYFVYPYFPRHELCCTDFQWHKKIVKSASWGEVPVEESASWGKCQLRKVPVEESASWGINSKNLTLGRKIFLPRKSDRFRSPNWHSP